MVQVSKARPLKQDGEGLTGGVAPARILHEAVEDLDLSIARSAAIGIAPFENLLVRRPGEHPLAQESCGASVRLRLLALSSFRADSDFTACHTRVSSLRCFPLDNIECCEV